MGAPAEPASAELVVVPFVDRLGCGASDAEVTPVFSYAGSGTAVDGGAYTASTAVSSYPGVHGSFSTVTGAPGYATDLLIGYGSDAQYREATGIRFPAVSEGDGSTLTLELPHPQAVEFTVGGIQSPSQLVISGSGPAGELTPSAEARSSAPGSARPEFDGTSVRISGALNVEGADAASERAVDVWFTEPIDRLQFTISASGPGEDNGFIITPPIACQSGAVSTHADAVGSPRIDAADGAVATDLDFSTTVDNVSPSSGAALYPAVTTSLADAASKHGLSLVSVIQVGSSAPACTLAPEAITTGTLLDASAPIAPGESCTLTWRATVSGPPSAADGVFSFQTALDSSVSTAARAKAEDTTDVAFARPGPVLTIVESGGTTAVAGSSVARTSIVRNDGSAPALGTTFTVDAPSGVAVTAASHGCTARADLTCHLGTLAPGASATVSYAVAIEDDVANGTVLHFATAATTNRLPDPTTSSFLITVERPQAALPEPAPPSQPAPPSRSPTAHPSGPVPPATSAPAPGRSIALDPPVVRIRPIALDLRFPAARLDPGTVSAMRGSIGPNTGPLPSLLTFTGTVSKGTSYRSIIIDPGGDCAVHTTAFSCTVTLEPGASATVEIRLHADPLNAPATVRQQLMLDSDDPRQSNAVTTSIDLARGNESQALAAAITRLDMSSFPGAFLPLLALLIYALAAGVAESERRRRPYHPTNTGRT